MKAAWDPRPGRLEAMKERAAGAVRVLVANFPLRCVVSSRDGNVHV
jgi:hypothetical protein